MINGKHPWESNYCDCYFDSPVHYGPCPPCLWPLRAISWPLPLWDAVAYTAFNSPNPVTALLTVRSGRHVRAITEIFKDAVTPSQIYFSQLWQKLCPQGQMNGSSITNPFQHSNLLSLCIPSSTSSQGRPSVSDFFTVDHLLVHFSQLNKWFGLKGKSFLTP